jgi:hypothetical protein
VVLLCHHSLDWPQIITGLERLCLCHFAFSWYHGPSYALAVSFRPWYRNTIDAYSDTKVGLRGHSEGAEEEGGAFETAEEKATAVTQK